jgi:hypothetical protein
MCFYYDCKKQSDSIWKVRFREWDIKVWDLKGLFCKKQQLILSNRPTIMVSLLLFRLVRRRSNKSITFSFE